MKCSGNFLNEKKKKIKGLFCIRRGAPKLSKLPERNSLFLPDCAHVFICPARAVVSRAFVSVGAALRWPGPLLGVCFLVLRTWGEGSQAGMFFMARRTAAVQSFILGLMWLLQFSLPHLSLKKDKFGTWTEMTAFSIMLFLKSPGARRDGNIHAGLE